MNIVIHSVSLAKKKITYPPGVSIHGMVDLAIMYYSEDAAYGVSGVGACLKKRETLGVT